MYCTQVSMFTVDGDGDGDGDDDYTIGVFMVSTVFQVHVYSKRLYQVHDAL